jgi:hypothetical protein
VAAAVHHASDSLDRLVQVHQAQARSAARARRYLVPTRSLPGRYDVARPYGPAPADRVGLVLSAYQQARAASSDAATSIADVAAGMRAPSRVLTLASAAAAEAEVGGPSGASAGATSKKAADVAVWEQPDMPGPVRRSLQSLGVTSPDLLRRGAAIDRAGEQLLIEACTQLPTQSRGAAELNTPATWSARDANAPGDRSTVIRQRPVQHPERESPEPEP